MFCNKCGKQLHNGEAVCPNCEKIQFITSNNTIPYITNNKINPVATQKSEKKSFLGVGIIALVLVLVLAIIGTICILSAKNREKDLQECELKINEMYTELDNAQKDVFKDAICRILVDKLGIPQEAKIVSFLENEVDKGYTSLNCARTVESPQLVYQDKEKVTFLVSVSNAAFDSTMENIVWSVIGKDKISMSNNFKKDLKDALIKTLQEGTWDDMAITALGSIMDILWSGIEEECQNASKVTVSTEITFEKIDGQWEITYVEEEAAFVNAYLGFSMAGTDIITNR